MKIIGASIYLKGSLDRRRNLIITRTPLRISFVGGGTDLPGYASKYTGEVISAAINKYVYVTVNEKFDGRFHLRYSQTENVSEIKDIQHTIVRECLKLLKVKKGIEIVTISDVPMKGTGLGSSSSLTVGLLKALVAYSGGTLDPAELAEMACYIEIDILGAPIGKQDQYVAAYGGFNRLTFNKDGSVSREELYHKFAFNSPLATNIRRLEASTMLFYTEKSRQANGILESQSKDIEDKKWDYDGLKNLVGDLMHWLGNEVPIKVAGEIIGLAWDYKKALCGQISSNYIDILYKKAKETGALGGKICGAGGGGFLLLVVPEERQDAITRALSPLKEMPFRFAEEGSEVIYADPN